MMQLDTTNLFKKSRLCLIKDVCFSYIMKIASMLFNLKESKYVKNFFFVVSKLFTPG